ncbi:MAG TPA: hypothetical protein VF292_07575 [Rhodanobacteraceae bacterium]
MTFVEMSDDEWAAVRKHHDALIEMAELELQADRIRETCPADAQQRLLQPIEVHMHQLGTAISQMAA